MEYYEEYAGKIRRVEIGIYYKKENEIGNTIFLFSPDVWDEKTRDALKFRRDEILVKLQKKLFLFENTVLEESVMLDEGEEENNE